MGVIDNVRVCGTAYDLQDARVAPLDERVNLLHGLVNYGYDTPSGTTGILKSRIGTLVVINGTTGGTATTKVLLSGTPVVKTGSEWPSEASSGVQLTIGHTYRLHYIVVSGTGERMVPRFYPTGTFTMPASQVNTDTESIITYNSTDYPDGVYAALTMQTGKHFSDYTVQLLVDDITNLNVTGATPSITATDGDRYVCTAAYVESLSFTPSATGICSVRFVSGTTPTLLSTPDTVKWPDWFDHEHLEASRTYEISIEDGEFGVVTSWT